MSDQKKSEALSFKIYQKNNSTDAVVSNPLQAIDIPFKFFRYRYMEPLESAPSSDNVDIKDWNLNLSNVTSMPIDSDGFLYIYYEKKVKKDEFDYLYGAEYQLNVYWSDNGQYQSASYTKIHPKSGRETKEINWKTALPLPHINLNKNDIVWIAYSKVRWSNDFRERIMNDFKSVQKRFQKLDVSSFIEGCKTAELRKDFFLPDHYGGWQKESHESQNFDIIYGYEKQENLNIYTFNLAAAILFVDDMCNLVEKSNNDFRDYMDKISSGIDPVTGESCPDKKAYQALFMSASILYPILLNMTDAKKNAADDDSPITVVQDEKFTILLDTSNREKRKEYIRRLQDRTLSVMNSNWFKHTLLDYLDNHDINILAGKEQIKEYYKRLKEDPFLIDLNVYSYDTYRFLKKGIGYNPSKDNSIIKFSIDHFFYTDEEEKQKYEKTLANTLDYNNITYEFDIIKLLLNTITDENKLFENRPSNVSITDIYNRMAEIIDNDDEDTETSLASGINNQAAIAARVITFTDSIFWYFTNFVTTTEHYHQLQKQLDSFKIVMKDLDIKLKNQQVILTDQLNKIELTYEERLATYKQNAKETKQKYGQAKAQDTTTSIRKTKKKEQRLEKTGEAYGKASETLENTQIDKETNIKSAERWDNKIKSKIELDMKSNISREQTITVRMETYERDSFAPVRKIAESKVWIDLVYSLSTAGLLSSIYISGPKIMSNNSRTDRFGNVLGLSSALTQFAAVVGDRHYQLHTDKWDKLVEKLNLKNAKMTFGVRFGIGSALLQAAADAFFAYNNFSQGNGTAASLYATSATTLGMATYCLWSISVAARTGAATSFALPYLSGTLMAISIVAGVAAGFYEYDDFKKFVSGTVFTKGGYLWTSKTINTTNFNTSHKMGMEMYKNRKEYSSQGYTGLGYTNANLQDFQTMFDIIRTLFTPIKCVFRASGHRIKGNDLPLIQYSSFRLWIKYEGGIFPNEVLEYEARLYPYGITQGKKTPHKELQLVAENDLTPDGGTLFRFVVNDSDINHSRQACLVILVRVRSLQQGFSIAEGENFYPSQRDEDTYLAYSFKLFDVFNDYYFFSVNLEANTISKILNL